MLILRHGGGNHVAVARDCCRGRDGAGVEPSLTQALHLGLLGRAVSRAVFRSATSFACLNTDRVQLFNSSNKLSSINWLPISLSVNVSSASRFMAAISQQNVDGLVPRDCLKSLTRSLARLRISTESKSDPKRLRNAFLKSCSIKLELAYCPCLSIIIWHLVGDESLPSRSLMVDELVGVSDCFEHMLSQYLEAHSTLVEGLDRLER